MSKSTKELLRQWRELSAYDETPETPLDPRTHDGSTIADALTLVSLTTEPVAFEAFVPGSSESAVEVLDASNLGLTPSSFVRIAPKPTRAARQHATLIELLQNALLLEFATIPPYLCALWSIKDERHPVANSIREVLQEEMLHLAMVCNLLASQQVAPNLTKNRPDYPTGLPGGIHEGLVVKLQGLNEESLDAFLQIEAPESPAANVERRPDDPPWKDSSTIGQLYEAILDAFRRLKPPLNIDRQVAGPLSWKVVANLDDVEAAIRLIQRQGEGAVLGPVDSGDDDLAHYYRFLEIHNRKRLVYDPSQAMYVWKGELQWPETRPMGPVPQGGFASAPGHVTKLLDGFDGKYKAMLAKLDEAWSGPAGQGALVEAIGLMFDLEQFAKPLMEIERLDLPGRTYGPQFWPQPAASPPTTP